MAVDMSLLPATVRDYVERVLPDGVGSGQTVRVEQVGEMVLKTGGGARRFTATEEFAVDRVAFAWRARFPILGPLSVRVVDSYDAGNGLLEVRLLGLPLQRKRGPELAEGEAYRYLAEIPWAPQAIVANPQLEWRQLENRSVEVATRVRERRLAVRLRFNDTREIAQTFAERPRAESGNLAVPWVGEFHDYRKLGGALIPTRGEVRWELPEGPFTYWRGTITSFELRD
jgi:hypothetical protein